MALAFLSSQNGGKRYAPLTQKEDKNGRQRNVNGNVRNDGSEVGSKTGREIGTKI